MGFRISGLPSEPFEHLLQLDAEGLREAGVVELRVHAEHEYPCRVSLEDAALGEQVLLVNFEHQPTDAQRATRVLCRAGGPGLAVASGRWSGASERSRKQKRAPRRPFSLDWPLATGHYLPRYTIRPLVRS